MKIQKQISKRWNPFLDFAFDCKSEIRISKSKSIFPNRTHPEILLDSSICQKNLDSEFQSLVGFRIPDSKTQDSRFHKQKFTGSL